ncbi:ABC transporter ATP-binding protein [Spirochaetota bacterium]|nr:ABC transporter ATP-binding protein [Spirochaetota bacterium]
MKNNSPGSPVDIKTTKPATNASKTDKGLSLTEVGIKNSAGREMTKLSLTFPPRSFNVILGRSNAGKTNLMRVLAGLDKPSSGRIQYDGIDVTSQSVRSRDIAMVYQEFINYPTLTVYENIASPLRVKKLSKQEIKTRVEHVANLLRLDKFLDRKPKELSGGQQQRVSIARALIKEAKYIFLNEPLANLDYKLREELRIEIKDLLRKQGATVFYATTDPIEPLFFDDYILLMKKGTILQYGKAREIYKNPANLDGMLLYHDPPVNVITATVKAKRLSHTLSAEKIKTTLSDGTYKLAIRAQHMTVIASRSKSIKLIVTPSKPFSLKVTLSEVRGSQTLIHLENKTNPTVLSLVTGVHLVNIGATIDFCFDWDKVCCFDETGQRISQFLA